MGDDKCQKAYGEGREVGKKDDSIDRFGIGFFRKLEDAFLGPPTKKEQSFRQGRDDGYYKDKGGDSCCYITTACLKANGIDVRSSPEFEAIKTLTREHILTSTRGKRDYIRYGREAPRIVELVEGRQDARDIWERTYKDLQSIARQVSAGDLSGAHRAYKELTLGLRSLVLN